MQNEPTGDPTPAEPTPAAPPAAGGEATDWEAKYRESVGHSREWEKRAKANAKAADELAAIRAASQTEQEKAVEAAKAEGRTAAAAEYGARLASAEFRAAVAAAGITLGDAADLIDSSRFVTAEGDVDTEAITAAVGKLAKLAPARGPGRSGGDMSGGNGPGPTLDAQIADAQAKGNTRLVLALKAQQLRQINTP